jgi:hypothetical protein
VTYPPDHPLHNPTRPWEFDFWTPQPLFNGETVFCLASGPSLTKEDADKLKGRRVIVVNSSYLFAPWADVLFFTDNGWYEKHKDLVRDWPGLVVTMSKQAKRELDDPALKRTTPRILRVKGCGDPDAQPRQRIADGVLPKVPKFPPIGSPEIQQGRNSGATAVSLAIAMGAAKVAMLGYDCRVVNGREHCHDEYGSRAVDGAAPRGRDWSLYDNEFKRAFNGWNESALASGVSIVNCTDGSAITEFPFAKLEDVL